ncbi:MAG: DUF697 domain-containing protein [bacterium]|nr:DUF697 domain-containing protein [bacterium]
MNINECDRRADDVIAGMVSSMTAGALAPAAINWVIVMSAMGAGVMSIGSCYTIKISKEEAADLIKQFFLSAGLTWCMLNVGAKICAAVFEATGFAYAPVVVADAVLSASQAFAIGSCAKAYFRKKYQGGDITDAELGQILKRKFKEYKKNH